MIVHFNKNDSIIGLILQILTISFSFASLYAWRAKYLKWWEFLLVLILAFVVNYLVRYFEKKSDSKRAKRKYVNTINNLEDNSLDYEIDYKDAIKNIKETSLGYDIDYNLAKDGDINSMCRVGYCYQYGKGVKIDMEQAVYWYEKAAFSGNENARIVLEKLNK